MDEKSRVHCSLNLNTETGRLSARKPNLQNQPALEKDNYKIRVRKRERVGERGRETETERERERERGGRGRDRKRERERVRARETELLCRSYFFAEGHCSLFGQRLGGAT